MTHFAELLHQYVEVRSLIVNVLGSVAGGKHDPIPSGDPLKKNDAGDGHDLRNYHAGAGNLEGIEFAPQLRGLKRRLC